MSSERQYNNSGILFKNFKKTREDDPDCVGDADCQGIKYFLKGWTHIDKNGEKYITFTMTRKATRNPPLPKEDAETLGTQYSSA
jgi:hypothetical protein